MKQVLFVPLLLLLPLLAFSADTKVYIVYFGEHSGEKALHEIEEDHHSYLFSVKKTEEEARASLLYSYKNIFNGFAASLTPEEAAKLSEKEEVVLVIESQPDKYSLQTTRSWEFSGVEETKAWSFVKNKGDNLLLKSKYGKDVIIGILDSGVWPESKSFSDEAMGPIPESWKGICQTGDNFTTKHCNRKIIGARYYLKGYQKFYGTLNRTLDYQSPRDKDGHGSHTASTAAGRVVPKVSALGGFAYGTASGGAPLARLAIYKVCWPIPKKGKEEGNTCTEIDMLAAMDDAVADGVHVISLSIGTQKPVAYDQDALAIGALHAAKKNIVVSCSAGNSGPSPATLSNPAPWVITVGASSLDRSFIAPVILGNGMKVEGQTVTPYKLKRKMYPLVHAAQVLDHSFDPKNSTAMQCLPGSLSPQKARGKIVFCLRGNGTRIGKGLEVKRVGAAGYILGNSPANGAELAVDCHVLPATAVTSEDAIKISKYINSTKNPTAYIVRAVTKLYSKPAPYMAAFTSRGPNVISPDILKPDITAPGLNILAAWTEGNSPTKLESDTRVVKYNILSGTSMSCPHVAGVAALLRAAHPSWSNAAIRSAIMTSAGLLNNEGRLITDASQITLADPFQYGSGHFRPELAADPGLVYDATHKDYLLFLCASGLKVVDPVYKCPKNPPATYNLNYPSLAIPNLNGTKIVKRTVTNVGGSKGVYFVRVNPPIGYSVKVFPPVLVFSHVGQQKSFTITVKANKKKAEKSGDYSFGWYTWTDGFHIVRSPMAVSSA
ncbi:hypothetical protein DCAR_0104220 [Daucus carota subsp. sativus]|uniref:Uncharacterized protein n=2 Tax=Daucus carota subsp. sativus TaxID=79200 RepID=A0A166IMY9_DAUCS|nr:hypothetical protein DCAR_0104220 [Daucus carota subsp. sativus]